MKINYQDLIINIFLIISVNIFIYFISGFIGANYNYYFDSKYSIYAKIIIFILSIITIFYKFALPIFSYFKKADTIYLNSNSEIKYSWGYGSSIVWLLLGLNFFILPLTAYYCFNLPIVSFTVVYFICAVFGFSLGIETKFENAMIKISKNLEKELRIFFDDAISSYLPALLLISIIFFPLEFYFDKNKYDLFLKIVLMIPLLVPIYFISKFFRQRIFSLIDLKKSMPNYTKYFIFIFPVIGICLFQSWEIFLTSNKIMAITDRPTLTIVMLFTGIIPIRLLYLYQPYVHIFNRLITIFCLIIYAYIKYINF